MSIKCPNCGSAAQVRNLTEELFACGCGWVFVEPKPQTKPVCPECGGYIDEIETYDLIDGGKEIVMYRIGKCNKCGQEYQYKEHYQRSKVSDLEILTSDYPETDDDCGFDPYLGCYTDDC